MTMTTMDTIMLNLTLYVFPLLVLLFFYSFKNKHLLWLAIPASALTLVLCGCNMPIYYDTAIMGFALHTVIVIAVTALAVFIKGKQKKQPNLRIPGIIAAVLCAALLCFAAYGVARDVSDGAHESEKPTVPMQTTTAAQETSPMPIADPNIEFTTQVVEAVTDPDFDAVALFKRLEGVWNDNNEIPGFMSFICKDGKPSLYCGVYDGDTPGVAALTGGREIEGGIAVLYFLYPAFDDVDGPIPERTDELQIDLTNLDNRKLQVQRTTIWGIQGSALTYRCKTLQKAGIRAVW